MGELAEPIMSVYGLSVIHATMAEPVEVPCMPHNRVLDRGCTLVILANMIVPYVCGCNVTLSND